MNRDDQKILESNCWTVECESPFEIRHQDGSFATGLAATLVLDYLRELEISAAKTRERKRNRAKKTVEFHGTGYYQEEDPPITGMSG